MFTSLVVTALDKPIRIGRFFSLRQGRVGQYLSPRVLLVQQPFQSAAIACYFGFDHLQQAQKFGQQLARRGYAFQMRPGEFLAHPYEIAIEGHRELAKCLAGWERRKSTNPHFGV
ncbi:MAG: hypothetical protein VKJ24_01990 [Synechococcales bacterium]|nr:hypothetical protein [Synechococcales bacterium]